MAEGCRLYWNKGWLSQGGGKPMQGILENGMPVGVSIPFPKMPCGCSVIVPPYTLQILSEVFSILKNTRWKGQNWFCDFWELPVMGENFQNCLSMSIYQSIAPWFFLWKKRQLPNIDQNFWKIVRLIRLYSKTYVQQNQCMMWLHSAILSENVADVNLQLCTHWATKVGSFTMKGT